MDPLCPGRKVTNFNDNYLQILCSLRIVHCSSVFFYNPLYLSSPHSDNNLIFKTITEIHGF